MHFWLGGDGRLPTAFQNGLQNFKVPNFQESPIRDSEISIFWVSFFTTFKFQDCLTSLQWGSSAGRGGGVPMRVRWVLRANFRNRGNVLLACVIFFEFLERERPFTRRQPVLFHLGFYRSSA
jgi:hypothetical protein